MGKFQCWDCGGSGVKEYYRVRGIDGGRCYTCKGTGKTNMPTRGGKAEPERDYEAEALEAMEEQSRNMQETDAALEDFRAQSFIDFPSDTR